MWGERIERLKSKPFHQPIQGWGPLVTFKLLGAVVGVLWLLLLNSRLPPDQLGALFGVVALFELIQHASSLGVHSYCDRFLTADWAQAPRAAFGKRLIQVFVWRSITLLAALTGLAALAPALGNVLGWGDLSSETTVLLAYMLCEGMFRFLELVLTSTMQQAACQALVFARGLMRLLIVTLLLDQNITVVEVLMVDIIVTSACGATALLLATRMAANVPSDRATSLQPLSGRIGFAWRSYVALLLERSSNVDVLKLLVSGGLGPAALALFGLAHAFADYAARYMPLSLFHGQLRAWLTARFERGDARSQIDIDVRLLLTINLVFLAVACPALVLFGDVLQRPAGTQESFGSLTGLLAALVPLSFLQTVRIALSLSAHLRADGTALLHAGALNLLAPLWVWSAAPSLGLVAAVLGCWWLELGPILILRHRHGQQLQAWCCTVRQAMGILASAVLAALVAAAMLQAFEGVWGACLALAALVLAYSAMLGALQPISSQERRRLWSALRR